jgi:two-component system, LytTR family, sensor histidine kinase AgrC
VTIIIKSIILCRKRLLHKNRKGPETMLFSPIIPTITLLAQLIIEYSTLTKRFSVLVHFVVRAVSLVIVYGGLYLLNHFGVRNYAVYYLLTAAYIFSCIALFKESLSQKIFLYFTNWGITSFLSSLCAWLAFWIANGTGKETLIRYIIYASSYVVIIPLYLKFYRSRVKEMLSLFQKGNPFYAAYPVLTFVVFVILFGPTIKPGSAFWFVMMVLFEGIIFFSYYLLFSQIFAVFSMIQTETHLRNTERHVLLQKKYYEEIDKGIRRQRELLHDTHHHVLAISSFLKAGDYKPLELYVEQLLDKTGREYSKRFCANNMANAIIGGYIKLAEEEGISVSVELDLPEALGIDDDELCTVFGNTIENAIEACQRIPAGSDHHTRRFINIKSKVDKGRLIIRIENTFDNKLHIDRGEMLSSKGSLGGIGLESVKSVIERYNGSASFETEGSTFILSAVLCLRPAAGDPPKVGVDRVVYNPAD